METTSIRIIVPVYHTIILDQIPLNFNDEEVSNLVHEYLNDNEEQILEDVFNAEIDKTGVVWDYE